MNLDKRYLVWSLSYATVGLALGIYMIHKLWLAKPGRAVANFQFVLHQAATIAISVGLFLLYGNMVPAPALAPILGIASAGVMLGMLLMLYMVIRFGTGKAA